ncbi:MAG TPA: nucleotidyltransferase family protein [Candidatus Dormibacteraeota bacterium]|nr:nucleotidyltransferase family protein [Candidatus Dormibacteraeota bacterium]
MRLLRWLTSVNPELSSSAGHLATSTSVEREWNLLLAASPPECSPREINRIRQLLEERSLVDWGAVLELADRHGTSSLLYRNLSQLPGDVPSPVLTLLAQRYQTNVHKSLFLTRELIRILDCLDGLGIEVLPYKGLVLSEMYYGDMALRQSGDLDLFVRKSDVARIKTAVRELGYTVRVPIPEEAEQDYIASGYECTFDSAAGKNVLELQWALQPHFYAVDFDMEGMFDRAVKAVVAGRTVKTPAPEDLVLVLSVHAAKHVWGRLIWLCDIAQVLKMGNLNWNWIEVQARELGIHRILCITLQLANRFMETSIPSPIEESMKADHVAEAFSDEISANMIRGVSYEEDQLSYFRFMMRLRERRADRIRFFTRLAFTPGPGEWEMFRLPKSAFPLYRLVRLARLAARFARG